MSEFFQLLSTQTRKILFVTAAHALACLALFEYLRRSLGMSEGVLLVHARLVFAAIFGALILAGVVARVMGQRLGALYLAAFVPSIVITTVVALDIVSFVTNRTMGLSLTRSLVKLWLHAWWDGEKLLPISTSLVVGAAAATVAALALELAIWTKTLNGFRPRASVPAAAGVAIALMGGAYPASAQDPILAFFGSQWTEIDAHQRGVFDRLRHDEPRRRAAYPQGQAFDRKNVIVITVDSLRADHLPLYGYTRATTPFLSRLHAEGTLRKVDFATSVCAESNCGISSALFSKTLRHQVAENFSLFALLKDQGYDVHFILSGNHDWMGQREVYGNELTSYFDGADSSQYGWSDDRVLVEGLERIADYQRPSFFFFHLMAPHIMAHKQEQYRLFQPAVVELDMEALFRGKYEQTSVVNNYDNGVVEADATIKDLFAVLDRKGYLQNSIVVILADHGEALGERSGMYGHINWLFQETISIPMLIYDASATPYEGLAFGSQLDVAPTVVDRLGLPIPPEWEGVSLLRKTAPRQTMHQTKLAKPCFAVIDYAATGMLKFMQCDGGKNEQLFDLVEDPRELRDLIPSADPALLAGFRTSLDQWRAR